MLSFLELIKAAANAAFLLCIIFIVIGFTGCTEDNHALDTKKTKNISNSKPAEADNLKNISSPSITDTTDIEQKLSLSLSLKFDAENTQPHSSFSCDQKIFAVISLHNYPRVVHNITINWLDPHDQQRESTSIPTFPTKPLTYTWASLALHRDGTAGMLQWINPAAGMEEFIGEWKVEVLIDDKPVETKKFTVVC